MLGPEPLPLPGSVLHPPSGTEQIQRVRYRHSWDFHMQSISTVAGMAVAVRLDLACSASRPADRSRQIPRQRHRLFGLPHSPAASSASRTWRVSLGEFRMSAFRSRNRRVHYVPNLTSDKDTGFGGWSTRRIVTAFASRSTADGRRLPPVDALRETSKNLAEEVDAEGVATPADPAAAEEQGAGAVGPSGRPTSLVYTILPGDAFASLPKPGGPPPAAAK